MINRTASLVVHTAAKGPRNRSNSVQPTFGSVAWATKAA